MIKGDEHVLTVVATSHSQLRFQTSLCCDMLACDVFDPYYESLLGLNPPHLPSATVL